MRVRKRALIMVDIRGAADVLDQYGKAAHWRRCGACPGRMHGCLTSWHDVHVDGAKVGYRHRGAG